MPDTGALFPSPCRWQRLNYTTSNLCFYTVHTHLRRLLGEYKNTQAVSFRLLCSQGSTYIVEEEGIHTTCFYRVDPCVDSLTHREQS